MAHYDKHDNQLNIGDTVKYDGVPNVELMIERMLGTYALSVKVIKSSNVYHKIGDTLTISALVVTKIEVQPSKFHNIYNFNFK